MINLSNQREVFWDDYLIDAEKTTAARRFHSPIRKGVIMKTDEPHEGQHCAYFSMIHDDGLYRLYYRAYGDKNNGYAYAESRDGKHFVKPSLGICEYNGSKDNNLILDGNSFEEVKSFDNIHFFLDENPACPKDERYKAVLMWSEPGNHALAALASEDGIHFRKLCFLTTQGAFDSQNIVFYDKSRKKYVCYLRGELTADPDVPLIDRSFKESLSQKYFDAERRCWNIPTDESSMIRSIFVMESEDFKNWNAPKPIDINAQPTQYYTNGVNPYARSEGIYVAFPSRYTERKIWTPSFDELCGRENRIDRMYRSGFGRGGMAITDSLFMFTRDGLHFNRAEETFIPPSPEEKDGWVYGTNFVLPHLLEVDSDLEGAEKEFMLLVMEGYRSDTCVRMVDYRLRLDGFASLHASNRLETVVTKPFTYTGETLYVNLATSARGGAYFALKSEDGEVYTSYETFGNSTEKRVHFTDPDAVKKLVGKAVTLEIRMLEADLYSLIFK